MSLQLLFLLLLVLLLLLLAALQAQGNSSYLSKLCVRFVHVPCARIQCKGTSGTQAVWRKHISLYALQKLVAAMPL
jgi:hypothetical protein